jgi:redox-sensitive bicupin YhaK (pirin superfamily)
VRHEAARDFTQYADLPRLERAGVTATVIIGGLEDVESPATAYSPLVGAELAVTGQASVRLRPDYEYGVLAIDDGLVVEGQHLAISEIAYVGAGRDSLDLATTGETARGLLLGGEPFAEELVMWWNFIGRSHEEIVEFRELWNDEDAQFGRVEGYDGDRLLAPPMPNARLRSRPRLR